MIFARSNINQLAFLMLFTAIFICGSLLMENYVISLDQVKSTYPVLTYSNTLDEADLIIDLISSHEAYAAHQIQSPDILKTMLLTKYKLEGIDDVEEDFAMPYQIEIQVKPLSSEKLLLFVLELSDLFPENIMQYNENVWKEIDSQNAKLRKLLFALQIVLLIIYIFVQCYNRLLYILKSKTNINAVLNSGISQRLMSVKNFMNNLYFLLISTSIIILINFALNYFHVIGYLITDLTTNLYYININLVIMLIISNFILVFVQQPILKRGAHD
jgi:hypothetical protein